MSAKDPLRYFRIEAREISEQLEKGALELESGATPELVARLLRLAHTLKGAAGIVKQRAIADTTHVLEDMLAPLRDRSGAVRSTDVAIILQHVDAIAAAVAALEPAPVPAAPTPGEDRAEEVVVLPQVDNVETVALAQGIAAAGVQFRGLRRAVELADQARQLAGVLADRPETSVARTRQFADELRRSVTSIEQLLRRGIDLGERELEAAHAATERLQLLPCSAAFAPLGRAVRETAQAQGKAAQVETSGGDIRIDAQVLGPVQRALVQMLRNAVAHGIEPPAVRQAAGKPATGTIRVSAERRGNRVAFTCADDGAGIDIEAVRRAAGRTAATASDAALLDLLFAGGLSTATTVTQASGRGVGLDVVRDAAVQLGGKVSAQTERGRGTAITLLVPVSLASLDALLVEHGEQVVAVPLTAVQHALRLSPEDVIRTAERETIAHDGVALPYLPLERAMPAHARTAKNGARSVLVVTAPTGRAAIGVDRLRGVANIVVRPTPALAFADPVIAGLYVDAEGLAQPVIDAEALVRHAAHAAAPMMAPAKRPDPILVIDDSLTTRVLEQSILESAGYTVELATCAEEGIEKARKKHYALFLVDVEMPGMDGFTFVATTRADPDLRKTPAILVTSRAEPEDRARGLAAGAHDYVVKGEFDQGRVLATIRALLEQG